MFKTTAKIDGMMCSMCESHVNDALRKAFDGAKVSASHTKGEASVISEKEIGEAEFQAALKDTGYKVLGVSSEPYEKKGLFSMFKK